MKVATKTAARALLVSVERELEHRSKQHARLTASLGALHRDGIALTAIIRYRETGEIA